MKSAFCSLFAAVCFWGAVATADEDRYSYVSGHVAYGGDPGMQRGYVDGMLMYRNDRPVICFGLQKRMSDPGRYLYILLFKPDVPQGGFSVSGAGSSDGDAADVTTEFKVNGCRLEIAYKFKAEEKGAVKSESLKINDLELSTDSTPIFLVDVSGDKAKLTPVKVKFTQAPPDVSQEKRMELAFHLEQTIAALKKDSPRVAEFLKTK